MALTDRDRAILDLERTWWTLGVRKDEAIRDRLGLSAGRYRRVLDELIDRQEAVDYDPLVVRRLRRRRAERRGARTSAERRAP
jgi:hypothetical protein